jgi:hypothetical protein
MKQKKYLLATSVIALFAIVIGLLTGCKKKIDDGFNLTINTDVVTTRLAIKFQDAANSTKPATGMKIEFTGVDAQYIYNNAGKKDFSVDANGILEIFVDPAMKLTNGNYIAVNMQVTSNDYAPYRKTVLIDAEGTAPIQTVKLLNNTALPKGMKLITKSFNLVNGVINTPTAIKILSNGISPTNGNVGVFGANDPAYFDDGNTSIYLPQGTKFMVWEKLPPAKIPKLSIPRDDSYYAPDTLVETIGTTRTYKLGRYVKVINYYPAEDSISTATTYQLVQYKGSAATVKIYTRPGNNFLYEAYDYSNGSSGQSSNVSLLHGNSPSDEIMFQTAVKERLDRVDFIGENNVQVYPDRAADWFFSLVIDEQFVNPVTKTTVKAGDLLEVGYNETFDKTVRAVVKKAANGQLRIENQSIDAGIYFRAPYTKTYSVTYNTDATSSNIPDLDNLFAETTLAANGNTLVNLCYTPNSGTITRAGKICTINPISITSSTNVRYCRSIYLKNGVNSTNVFAPPFQIELPPIVTFDVTLVCPIKNKSIRPTYYGKADINGKSILVNLFNGSWQTRAYTQGEGFTISGRRGKDPIQKDITVNGTFVKVVVESNGPDFCAGW